jgi:Carboxypeptidase regulatory-like domain
VSETNTGISKETTTDSHGTYELPNLQAGNYQVAVIASGFDKYVRANIPLDPRASVPAPTTANVDPLDPTDNYLVNFPQPITADLYDIRVDQKLSDKQSIFGRFSWKNQPSSFAHALGTNTGSRDVDLAARSLAISHNYSIKANLLNELRFGYLQQTKNYTYPKFPNGAQLISSLGLQASGPFLMVPPSQILISTVRQVLPVLLARVRSGCPNISFR